MDRRKKRQPRKKTLIGIINTDYVYVSNNMTTAYEKKYGLYCDLFFPVRTRIPNKNSEYDKVNIFEPHEQATYREKPDVVDAKFYIPYLLKRENMNSSDSVFDSIFMGEFEKRPFIETTKKRELPIMTKVVVKIGDSNMYFWVDKKTVVNGAGGHMLLRQYLSPLLEENDERDQEIREDEY